MALVAVAVVVVLAVLSAGKHRNFDRCYAEAFLPRSPLCLTFQLAGVVLLAIGGFLALAHWVQSPVTDLGQRTVSIAWRDWASCPAGRRGDLFCDPENAPGPAHPHRLGHPAGVCRVPVDHVQLLRELGGQPRPGAVSHPHAGGPAVHAGLLLHGGLCL